MGESGYVKYQEKFGFTNSINKMEKLYLKLINKNMDSRSP
jgi:hypothetical protein